MLDEVRRLDSSLSQAIESYNYANIKLTEIDGELRSNLRHLVVARHSLGVARSHIALRLKSLYVNGATGGVVEIVLGARSFDDLLDRLEVIDRVGDQDRRILEDVKRFRKEVAARRERLERSRAAQATVVAERAAYRRSIEGQLAERQRLLSSIREEIARLEAAERRRQERLAAQARARLLQQRLLAARAARDRAAENAAAREAAAAPVTLELGPAPEAQPGLTDQGIVLAPPPARYGGVVGIAMRYLGIPYRWGGMSPSGFDCSGLIAYVYAQVGVPLPHHAASQFSRGTPVSRGELQPGDLVFFDGLGHAGIYIGGDQFIHSPHTGDVVKISSLNDSWYAATWVGARRL